MIGEKFNRWTVLEQAPSRHNKKYWKCQCECGTIREVCGTDLRNGKSKSCGCYKKEQNSIIHSKDLSNQHFGYLTAINKIGSDKFQNSIWHCKCDCGNECDVAATLLIRGITKSCGCYQKERTSETSRLQNLVGQTFGFLTVIEGGYSSGDGYYRKCQCQCGNIVYVKTSSLMFEHVSSCGCKNFSKGEEKIKNLLEQANINYIKEYTPNTLPFKGRFDFYIPSLNTVIEYDGIQHFKKGNGYYDNDKKFAITQEHDQIKNQWCKDNDIILIRIPYTKYDTLCIEDLLPKTSSFKI